MAHDFKDTISDEESLWIDAVLDDILTFKNKHWFNYAKGVAKELPDSPNILVLGCALGVEAISFAKWSSNPKIMGCDLWNDDPIIWEGFQIKENQTTSNTKLNFINNCKKWSSVDIEAKQVNLHDKEKVNELMQTKWDLIFYDAFDLGVNSPRSRFGPLKEMLMLFWSNLETGGILMGDDYYIKTNTNMTPLVNSICEDLKLQPIIDVKGNSWHWILLK